MKKDDDNYNWQAFWEGFAYGLMRMLFIGGAVLLLFALYIHLQQ